MNKKIVQISTGLLQKTVLASLLVFSFPAHAAITSCKVIYNLEGWSFFYKEYKGEGVVTCNNGQQANVLMVSRGGGLTFGKSKIDRGQGVFSGVYSINEIFGNYISMSGHAGLVTSVEGQAMTKGEVSLVLSGKGRGVDLGLVLSAFSITAR